MKDILKKILKSREFICIVVFICLAICGGFAYKTILHIGDSDYRVLRNPESIIDLDESAIKVDTEKFEELIKENKIYSVYGNFVDNISEKIYFNQKDDITTIYQTPNYNIETLKDELLSNNIKVYPLIDVIGEQFKLKSNKTLSEYILFVVVTGLIFIVFLFAIRGKFTRKKKSKVGISTISKNGNNNNSIEVPNKKFSDIGGLTQLKEDLKAVVDFLKYPDKYKKAGASLPRGILLIGEPGTGKTLVAKVMASEAGVNFVYANASDFTEMYVGVGPKRVRELFKLAKDNAPSIIFIDEIDTISAKRSHDMNSEDRKTLTALLTEMDGFSEEDNLLVIGATNRIEDIDSAAIRPGRFTDIYTVPVPETLSERLEVIDIYMSNKKFAKDFDKVKFAEEMIGRSPAEIEEVFNEAAIISVRKRLKKIDKYCIEEAIYKRLMKGHKGTNKETNKEDLKLIAYHEAGHTLVAKLGGNSVTKVTIIPSTSGAGGVTFIQPPSRKLYTKEMLEQKIMEFYAGKIGEYLISGKDWSKTTQGCSNDIEQATKYLKQMVDAYGMSDNGMINMNILSQDTHSSSIEYIKKEAKKLQDKTIQLLEDNFNILQQLAKTLLKKDTIYEEEIDKIIFDAKEK